jgi:hypothetical protein
LKPYQAITAEVKREQVTLTVNFEVLDKDRKGIISYPDSKFSNMESRLTIHEYFCTIGPRIPPYEEYAEVNDGPYYDHGVVNFYLQDGIDISDQSSEGPAAAGGNNWHDIMLSPIDFPPRPIGPIRRNQGAKREQSPNRR